MSLQVLGVQVFSSVSGIMAITRWLVEWGRSPDGATEVELALLRAAEALEEIGSVVFPDLEPWVVAVFVGGEVGGGGDAGEPDCGNDDQGEPEGAEGGQGGDEQDQGVAQGQDAESGEVVVLVEMALNRKGSGDNSCNP